VAKLSQTVQATTTVQTTVALKPNTRLMVRQRCEEHAALAKQIADLKARQDRIKEEVETLFVKDKQGKALADGTVVDGYKVKMVCGSSRKLDTAALMKAHGLSKADLDDCTVEKPNTPYIKITAPGGKERDDE
jgi:TorA maturation chaperone TorD